MARWSRDDRTLHAKVVYYGPACGGKTTNLDAIHRTEDARRGHELLALKTKKDSTLFFDMLPFELDDVLGCRLSLLLYTVPGLVRYDAMRKVVLNGTDVIVFVADSSPSRREQNIWSIQNLHMNMRAKQVDPERVPVLYQINKRDVPDAAPAADVAEWLGLSDQQVIPAIATRGDGVLETLKAAFHALIGPAFALVDPRPPEADDADALVQAIDHALAPYEERVARGWPAERGDDRPRTPIVLTGDDLLEGAIETSVRLGEGRSAVAARARRLAREADGFRRLGESLCEIGAGSDRPLVATRAIEVAREVLNAAAVTLVAESSAGHLVQEGAAGWDEDPLLAFPSGRQLLRRVMSASEPTMVDDLAEPCSVREAGDVVERLRSMAAVQVVADESKRVLLAYAARPDGSFDQDDMRFLQSVARHVAAGLGRARAHEDLIKQRDRLERSVAATDHEQRRVRRPRRVVDQIRERFLGSLSSEMQAPLAAVASAATAIHDYQGTAAERKQLAASIISSAELLGRQLGDLSRLVNVATSEPLRLAEAPSRRLVDEAIRMAGHEGVRAKVEQDPGAGRFDLQGLARAIANMIDNAVKFSPSGAPVRVQLGESRIDTDGGTVGALTVSVLDRGQGVPKKDRGRIFAPFAQGDGGRAGVPPGMGIGLYEARCLAQRHGGRVEYAPRKGGGSDFRLIVPLQPVAEEKVKEVTCV